MIKYKINFMALITYKQPNIILLMIIFLNKLIMI